MTPDLTDKGKRQAAAAAAGLALQAGNYARAVAAGIPHDIGEARSILAGARRLVDILEGKTLPAGEPR